MLIAVLEPYVTRLEYHNFNVRSFFKLYYIKDFNLQKFFKHIRPNWDFDEIWANFMDYRESTVYEGTKEESFINYVKNIDDDILHDWAVDIDDEDELYITVIEDDSSNSYMLNAQKYHGYGRFSIAINPIKTDKYKEIMLENMRHEAEDDIELIEIFNRVNDRDIKSIGQLLELLKPTDNLSQCCESCGMYIDFIKKNEIIKLE